MKPSSYCIITAVTALLIAVIISSAINPPRTDKENMELYVKSINEALLLQFVERTLDLKNRDAWSKPELFGEIDAMCSDWKSIAHTWKDQKVSHLIIGTLCDIHEARVDLLRTK